MVLSIPFVGTWLAFLFFGGAYPSQQIVSRLFVLHILVVPVLIAALLGAHLAIMWHQKHTQFPGPGRTETNVVGTRLWPAYAAKSVGLLLLVAAVLAALGGLVQINPVWLWGPYDPTHVTTAAQPDWYVGFLEGALRLAPPWSFTIFGHTVSELFLPAVVLPGDHLRPALRLALPRAARHGRPGRAQPAGSTPGPSGAHRHRRRACSPSTPCSPWPAARTSSLSTSACRSPRSPPRCGSPCWSCRWPRRAGLADLS